MRPPGPSASERGRQRITKSVQFAVDGDAQRLERALGRMPTGAAGRRGNRVVQEFHQLAGSGERATGAPTDDLGGDPSGEPLLTELAQDARQCLLVVGVDDLGRGQRRIRIHPHVQRRVCGVGESALGAVQLHR